MFFCPWAESKDSSTGDEEQKKKIATIIKTRKLGY